MDHTAKVQAARAIVKQEYRWWRSPRRVLWRGMIAVFGGYFMVNGLGKGGVTLMILTLCVGDRWFSRHHVLSIVIAVAVGLGVIFPLGYAYRREQDEKTRLFNEAYSRLREDC